MADEIARALEALAADSNRWTPSSAAAVRRRGDHRRVAMRAAATGATMTVVGATAGTAAAIAGQSPSASGGIEVTGSASPSPRPVPASTRCESNAEHHLAPLAVRKAERGWTHQQRAGLRAARRHVQEQLGSARGIAPEGASGAGRATPGGAIIMAVPHHGRPEIAVCVHGAQPTPSPSPRSTVTTSVAPSTAAASPSPRPSRAHRPS